ncbi:MAG: acetyl-CoA carboxylase biotin carboxylase subunit [Armatimonadetes bacterium]|nr:acetyl-CoA carboxylase biotin carboxylase subunit [Armatimonadota bacterium]
MKQKPFTKVLIANRGEIAVRIIRACRELGLETVAVYSDADRTSLHVRMADEAVSLGDSHPRESYSNAEKLIQASVKTHSRAVHPGYGFLAENRDFAVACREAGLVFIGPSPTTLGKTGDKEEAKRIVSEAGVPLIPGSHEAVRDVEDALREARQIGFPVLLKASMGGGGRGMRRAGSPQELTAHFDGAQSEARLAFGDPRIYVEKCLIAPRHIEFQILADGEGRIIHLGERECSLQRRFQKLVEESPSPIMDEDLRQRMGEAAVRAATAAGYVGAGTVEFLVDEYRNFYFMEINARIQVEHPVTEMVTSVDLIAEQIKVAQGHPLSFGQGEVHPKGWAIEARINCEDPFRDFVPSPGKIQGLRIPGGFGVRFDTAMYPGYAVPEFYDSLVGKLIAWGHTREEARSRLIRALGELEIAGIPTTAPFLMQLLGDPAFISGNISTTFLSEYHPPVHEATPGDEEMASIVAALEAQRQVVPPDGDGHPNLWSLAGRVAQFRKW